MNAPEKFVEKQRWLCNYLCLFIVAMFLLGGANENDWLANVALLYLATPLLALSFYHLMMSDDLQREAALFIYVLGVALVIPLLQLVPLPEKLWRKLPFHDVAAHALASAGIDHPSGPLSLAPHLTWVSLLSSLPPLAVFVTALLLNRKERRSIILVLLICGGLNAMFGLMQSAQNSSSGYYFYPGMSAGDATGFFKNRNHFAAQMYALLPFAAAVVLDALNVRVKSSRRHSIVNDYRSLFLGLSCVFIFIVTCVFAKSRAGVVILMVGLIWILFLPDWNKIKFRGKASGNSLYLKALGVFLGLAVVFSMEYAFYRVMNRFETETISGVRQEVAQNTLNAAIKAFPYGTGLGTFQRIYAVNEPVENVLPHKFVNHAHNDYLELFLETGVAGLTIIVIFLFWYFKHVWNAWWRRTTSNPSPYVARASCMTIGLLLLHSFVDYPLRTQILMGLFSLSCAFLIGSKTDAMTIEPESNERNLVAEPRHIHGEHRRRRSSSSQ